jgi:hypothetical protein
MKKISLFLVSLLFVSSTAYAIAPAIIWIGRTMATMTLENIAVEGVTRGFAANDPYVKNRVTIPSKNIPAAFRKTKGWLNPYWAAFALAAGLMYDDSNGFQQLVPTSQHVYRVPNCPKAFVGSIPKQQLLCGWTGQPAGTVVNSFTIFEGDLSSGVVNCPFYQYGTLPCYSGIPVKFSVTYSSPRDGTPSSETWTTYVDRTRVPIDMGKNQKPISDAAVATMAMAYLASDNRPDAAFMNTAGDPIPELMENAVIEPVPNVDANTLADLAAYRAGQLQTTDPLADHYVTPERLEEIKKLAAQQDAANTPEGELDALNEKMKQPITQAQYEETNKKYSDAVDAVTNTLPNNDADTESIDDSFNKLDGIITDIPNTTLPSPAHIQLPHYTECMTLSLTDGKGRELVFPSSSQCDKINQMKSLIGYFLAGLVAMGLIWQLLTRPHG